MIDTETLLKQLQPYQKETLSGFILRTAKENLMSNPTWIIDAFNQTAENPLHLNTIDWIENGTTLNELALFTGLEEKKISKMTFPHTLKDWKLDWDDIYKCPWFIYRTVKCCPHCLESNLFIRKDWCLSQSICCAEHQNYLIDLCTRCERELNPKIILEGQCVCGLVLNKFETKAVHSSEVMVYQNYLNQFLYEDNHPNYNEWIKDAPTFFRAIEFFASWIPLITNERYIPSIDGFSFDGTAYARTRLKKTKALSQSVVIYLLAHTLLKSWPESYHKMLDFAFSNDKKSLEMFYLRAVTKHMNTSLKVISLEFTKFLQTKFHRLGADQQLLRMDEAKFLISRYKETGITVENLPHLQCYLHKTKIILFYSEEVINWISTLNVLITKEELREIWNTSARATHSILANKILDNVLHFKKGSVAAWGVPLESLTTFCEKLKQKSSKQIDNTISLNKALKWVGPDNAHLIVNNMLNGNLNFVLELTSFGESLISKSQCYFLVEELIFNEAEAKGVISIRNLVFIFGVKKSDILYWIRTGRMKLHKVIDSVSFSSFENFYNLYLTTYQLSFRKKKTVKQILKLHSNGKIKASYGPHTGDGERLLFQRGDY